MYEATNSSGTDFQDDQSLESLRTILADEQRRNVSIKEAADVAGALLSFYELLGSVSNCERSDYGQ